ncbi:exodeoxyribonuclease V subunit gamma [Paraglaciecola arctica]|uniref:exodeoxyribonuclease V subunit gamma n=1 Tax=Paraglaciecola arctica TaxID=1128911 RepID=UPI001C07B47F|nr:exodeoxyribonuclease V subunit gamma [Paraglaciecola arctica]MBU3001781.1 exodeoxyribonuclease V subunit gamma [Paraglaciecola arctica]
MLYLVQSNKMECLAESLISCLQDSAQQGSSIFESEQILVQSPGMSQWLKIQIAEELGIAANIDFPLPSSFIWQLYQQHVADLPEQSAFTKPNMTWKLMSILPAMLQQEEFTAIKQYLSGSQPLKLYQLACKIADVYDQYLVYRPDWILHWEAGQNDLPDSSDKSICESHPWQPVLWRALVKHSDNLGESRFHRANLHHTLLEALQNASSPHNKINQKPLMVFGISAMPMQQLEVLSALAESRDVLIFWFNPSQHYWGDIVDKKTQAKAQLKALDNAALKGEDFLDIGNPLLASWGKLGRDYQDMLLGLELQQQDCFIDIQATSLLEHIQSDVNNLQFRATANELDASELLSNGQQYPKVELTETDISLQIHACHSKVRELEVLHDQLLQRFNDNPHWHPGDVIVMMPDVATYAPFIEGVFGAVDSQLSIPYAISDRNVGQVSPLLASFLQLMKLHQSRLTLSEVLSLLEVPAIQRKFAIDTQEFELLQHWLIDAGVRWGWDENDKQRWDLPSEQQNTWVFGLQRLLAGYAMSSVELYQGNYGAVSAYADIEGQQAVALGKCYQFTAVLLKVLAFCQESQNLQGKIEQGLVLLSELYEADDTEQTDMQVLRETLEKMLVHTEQYTDDIDQDVFVSELQQNIQEKGVGQRFLAGYVNFCTLMPMRSIPFKMVCLLGMNDADYPRQSVPMGFDLMRVAPVKRGDRSRRLDDRYLFLEALLSAREQLYFSYQGFSQKDNSPLAPSILLSELLEYCQQGFCLTGQLGLAPEATEKNLLTYLTIKHKLQPFSEAYFEVNSETNQRDSQSINDSTRHISFNQKQQAIAKQIQQPYVDLLFNPEPLVTLTEQSKQLDLEELIQFFQNPAKAFFIQRWQTRFYPLGQQNSDEEPFAFDGLDRYQVNERLVQVSLEHIVSSDTDESDDSEKLEHLGPLKDTRAINANLLEQLKAEGKLPAGQTGTLAMRPLTKQSAQLAQQICEVSESNNTSESLDIELLINDIRLTGRVGNLDGRNLILWRTGKLRAKDRIALYLQWLCLCAHGSKSGTSHQASQAYFISTDKLYSLPSIEQHRAIQLLGHWLKYWQNGSTQLLHFYPEAAWQWVNTQDLTKTIAEFNGNDFAAGEGSEAHIQRVCPDLSVHFEPFSQVADELLLPLVELGDSK